MKANIKWLEDMQFVGQSGSGHSVILYSPDNSMGISPVEMLLLGLGGRTSFDVVSILKKVRQNLKTVELKSIPIGRKNHRESSPVSGLTIL